MIIIEKYLGLRQAADDGQASGLEWFASVMRSVNVVFAYL